MNWKSAVIKVIKTAMILKTTMTIKASNDIKDNKASNDIRDNKDSNDNKGSKDSNGENKESVIKSIWYGGEDVNVLNMDKAEVEEALQDLDSAWKKLSMRICLHWINCSIILTVME